MRFRLRGEAGIHGLLSIYEEYERSVAVFATTGLAMGESQPAASGSTGSSGGKTRFYEEHTWGGPLKPGDAFRIGLVKKHKPAKMAFILEVPPRP